MLPFSEVGQPSHHTATACAVVGVSKLQTEVDSAIDSSLDTAEKDKTTKLLEFSDVFSEELGLIDVTKHTVNTGDHPPIKQRPRRLPYVYRDEANQHIRDILAQNIIRPSSSPWSSPIVLVRKKDGQLRFCVDYRKLNQVTKNDAHPLPRIDDTLDALKNARLFSTLDLRSGYWQIPIDPKDQAKTAFVTHNGLYEFLRMPFGLLSAPSTFQRTMEIVLSGLSFEVCLCYLDDVIIYSQDFEQHCTRPTYCSFTVSTT